MKKQTSAVVTVLVAIVIVAVLGILIVRETSMQKGGKVLATVDGHPITQTELDREYASLPPQIQLVVPPEQFLDQLIERQLLLEEANRQGISVNPQDVGADLASIRASFPTEAEFQKALADQGFTEEEVLSNLEDRRVVAELLARVVINVTTTPDEEEAYYQQHLGEFSAASEQIHAAHILVNTKEDADALSEKIRKGASFAELARNYSLDPSATTNEGDLGFFGKGEMVKEFEDVAFTLDIGDVSAPVQTQFGYHLIARLPNTISLEQARNSISQVILRQKQSALFQAYVDELRKKAVILYPGIPQKRVFTETGDALCEEDGKPIVRMYLATSCTGCRDALTALNAASEGKAVMKIWQLDTGDNLATQETEKGLPKEELALLQKYNPSGAVPAYVIGCKYVRIGNAYSTINLHVEEQEFQNILAEVI